MSLSENTNIDEITVTRNGIILVRQVTEISRDGAVIAKTNHRYSYAPGSDIKTANEQVAKIASLIWTDEVIEAYKKIAAAE